MAPALQQSGRLVPAQLGFLAIYNPSLGTSDETLDEQIVYYASLSTQAASRRRHHGDRTRHRTRPTEALSPEERHERLRQIGLAQAMATFSSGFSNGAPVDVIDTEQSRVLVHELEPGWWLLASIDLNKVPLPPRLPTKASTRPDDRFEYSARDLKPPPLLLRDLLRAHCIFLLHHGTSLSALFVRCRRTRFVALLSRYWDLFLSTWSVTLHGNPARDMLGGINIAASGELGVGVGEEDRGSGEREVLEGLVGRVEGLVDLVVCKFGSDEAVDCEQPWLGTGREPTADDGAIFLGLGALSRQSLKHVTHWMEDLYTWGEHAYGVIDSPTSVRRAKARQSARCKSEQGRSHGQSTKQAPRVSQAQGQGKEGQAGSEALAPPSTTRPAPKAKEVNAALQDGRFDKMLSYIKFGYGSYWTLPGTGQRGSQQPGSQARGEAPAEHGGKEAEEAAGHYLIGLRGEIEEGWNEASGGASSWSSGSEAEHNSRTVVRTVYVELEHGAWSSQRSEETMVRDLSQPASQVTAWQVASNMVPGAHSLDSNKTDKLRVVVYVNRPFVYAFLFGLHTDSLAWEALYRSLHYQLAPLRRPLLASTRYRRDGDAATRNIMSLVWDPASLAVHCSLPNIAAPSTSDADEPWSRLDALSTHVHLVNLWAATRRTSDVESTLKTSRGWWIVWTRLAAQPLSGTAVDAGLGTIVESAHASEAPASPRSSTDAPDPHAPHGDAQLQADKEIFLIRRASDHVGLRGDKTDGADGAARLLQGIGIDTRRYVEDLLSLL
ncbi:hypothetical protein CDD81_7990 [Ophiocordyceps australis]|uniref:CCZ1/INTU/HSP4 first Longin domain-containing protein n=1 Tax=Ophiocordyceps australis TaxID=1399860 RepID=A0A2C5Y272_9HYPO|nr:hypothetical protein CDD81_7990 [Ophiocordyceps australis]